MIPVTLAAVAAAISTTAVAAVANVIPIISAYM